MTKYIITIVFSILILVVPNQLMAQNFESPYKKHDGIWFRNKDGANSKDRFFFRISGGRDSYGLLNLDSMLVDKSKYSGQFKMEPSKRSIGAINFDIGAGPASFPLDFELGFSYRWMLNNSIDSSKTQTYDLAYDDQFAGDGDLKYYIALNSAYWHLRFMAGCPLLLGAPGKSRFVIRPKIGVSRGFVVAPNEIEYISTDDDKVNLQVRENLRNVLELQNNFNILLACNFELHFGDKFFVGLNYEASPGKIMGQDLLFVSSNSYGLRDKLPVYRTWSHAYTLFLGFALQKQ